MTEAADESEMLSIVEALLAKRQVALAHCQAAEWSAKSLDRADAGWRLQRVCFEKSPFVQQFHDGLEVFQMQGVGGGYAMRTRLPIGKHELILKESPAIDWIGTNVRDPKWVQAYLAGKLPQCQEQAARLEGLHPRTEEEAIQLANLRVEWLGNEKQASCSLPAPVQELVTASENPGAVAAVFGRLQVNSHSDGIHVTTAFMNHSCVPNCENRSKQRQMVYTTRDIAAGEELCIAYLSTGNLANLLGCRPRRNEVFRDSWGIQCACERCRAEMDQVRDFAFEKKITDLQSDLQVAEDDDFAPLARRLLQQELVPFDGLRWKQDLADIMLHFVLELRLHIDTIPSKPEDLLLCITAVVEAHDRKVVSLGESGKLNPWWTTLNRLVGRYEEGHGPLPTHMQDGVDSIKRMSRDCARDFLFQAFA
mmetsp:Transcript_3721/g.7368  ORF Transcript_3721/g.7368 Transcript_3721/m.7368 type:complete len:422 (-) Transcript_3721:20-1285(-)